MLLLIDRIAEAKQVIAEFESRRFSTQAPSDTMHMGDALRIALELVETLTGLDDEGSEFIHGRAVGADRVGHTISKILLRNKP